MTCLCWHCWNDYASRKPATTTLDGLRCCYDCADRLSEWAHERFVSSFYGGAGPDVAKLDAASRDAGRLR